MANNKVPDLFKKDDLSVVYASCKDHTVSGEDFGLFYNKRFEMLVTIPQPSIDNLSSYYESEDYISHTDSSDSFLDKIYQGVKKYSINRKFRLLDKPTGDISEEKVVLDVGCGTGDFLAKCKNNYWNVVGIEPNLKARHIAENKVGESIYNDISELTNEKFDCITMWHVLEHVPDLLTFIPLLKKLLKPGGTLIIAVPNYKSYDAVYYKQFWAAFDVPRHLWHFSKESIGLLFSREKMIVMNTKALIFDSFYVSLLSEKYKHGTSNMIRAFFIGCFSNIKAMINGQYSSIIYMIKRNN